MTLEKLPDRCPFCGNETPYVIETDGGTWGVYCEFCNGQVRGYKTPEDAVRRWDRRYRPDSE